MQLDLIISAGRKKKGGGVLWVEESLVSAASVFTEARLFLLGEPGKRSGGMELRKSYAIILKHFWNDD